MAIIIFDLRCLIEWTQTAININKWINDKINTEMYEMLFPMETESNFVNEKKPR